MTQWELSTYYVDIDTGGFTVNVDLSVLWARKDKKLEKPLGMN